MEVAPRSTLQPTSIESLTSPTGHTYKYEVNLTDWHDVDLGNSFQVYPRTVFVDFVSKFGLDWIVEHPVDAIGMYIAEAHKEFPTEFGPLSAVGLFQKPPDETVQTRKGIFRHKQQTNVLKPAEMKWSDRGECPSWDEHTLLHETSNR